MPQARGLPRSGAIPAPGQTGTGEGKAAHGDTTPLLRWTHRTMGESKPRPRLRRLVVAQWIVERRAAACCLRADLARQPLPRRRGRVDRVRASLRGPQPPARFPGRVLKPDKLSLQGISESPDGVTVSLADQPGVEVLSVQEDVAKQAPVAVLGVAGGVSFERSPPWFQAPPWCRRWPPLQSAARP